MANTEIKVTKAMKLAQIKTIVEAAQVENKEELIETIDKILESDAKKAESAKKRAAEKRAQGDNLQAEILKVLTEEFQSVDQILEQVEFVEIDGGVTRAKVINRLGNLVKSEPAQAIKEETKIGEKKVMAYKLV